MLTKRDVVRYVPESSIRYHFGSLTAAIKAAGLTPSSPHKFRSELVLSNDDLFTSLHGAEVELGREPTFDQYRSVVSRSGSGYSNKPFKRRFGPWSQVLVEYRRWKEQHQFAFTEPPQPEIAAALSRPKATSETASHDERTRLSENRPTAARPQLFGSPIDFRGLRHAPINEQGVVYLFGMVSRELGFAIESIQQGFPDCEGKYLHDRKRGLWARARIEFEFKASNFLAHGHAIDGCDFIVCWLNDWPDCPLQVIELSSEIKRLA